MVSSSSSTRANRGSGPSEVNNTSRSSPTSLSGQSKTTSKNSNTSKPVSNPSSKYSHKSSPKHSSKNSSKYSAKSSSKTPSKSASSQPEDFVAEAGKPSKHINGILSSSPPLDRYASSQTLSNPQYTIFPVVMNEDTARARAQAVIEEFDDRMEFHEEQWADEGENLQ